MHTTLSRPRRVRPLVAASAAALLALSGCASGADDGTDETSSADALMPEGEGSTAYPLTLETWAGETELEERPERIAVLGFSPNLDAMQALGVTPVYTVTEETDYAWRDEDLFDEIEEVDTATRDDPFNVEGIAATEPDLIVAVNSITDKGDYDKLADIAPVLDVESEADLGDKLDWRDAHRLVGEALDLPDASDEVIDEADAAVAATAKKHPEFKGKTVTIATDYGGEYDLEYYTTTGGTAENLMTELGFSPNPHAKKFTKDAVVSAENVSLLDADALVVSYADEKTRKARESEKLFAQIPPVKDDRYVSLAAPELRATTLENAAGEEKQNPTWVLRRGASPISIPWAAEVVADEWLADLDLS